MASKNKTTIIALYLIFLGFVSAQPPVAEPLVCPLTATELISCVRLLDENTVTLTGPNVATCCNVLAGVGVPNAPECACEAARNSILGGIGLGPSFNTVRATTLLSSCPVSQLPTGGVTCSL